MKLIAGCCVVLAVGTIALTANVVASPDAAVLAAQQSRVETIDRASKPTIAIFDGKGKGGGSGVLISPDGFALTNFHVTAPCGPAMKCGLSTGELYDAVIVGIDPVGDVALIQLLGRDDFPTAEIGDSDAVRAGDWVFAAGNPFLLADDFTPSISYGIVSGVHRYQYPAGTLLEYADCIQTDAAINPGNSGGPLFDAQGKLIGVNGRASFEKRGRVNVGVGYSISINQIMRFVSHLKGGRIVDHATLGATASTSDYGEVTVNDVSESSDAYRRGLRYGDQIVEFAGREINSANALKNALGVFPPGWRTTLAFRRDGARFEAPVRLMPLHAESELVDLVQQQEAMPSESPDDEPRRPGERPEPGPQGREPRPGGPTLGRTDPEPELPAAVARRFELRRGFANYWYNQTAQQRIWDAYLAGTALAGSGYQWEIEASLPGGESVALSTTQRDAVIRLPWSETNALFIDDPAAQLSPPGSGGLLLAVHLWQRLLDKGLRQFGEVYYLGQLPFGPESEMADRVVGIYAGVETHFCFSSTSGQMIGIEMFPLDDVDPCELALLDFEELNGKRLPRRWVVRHGDAVFAEWTIDRWEFPASAASQRLAEPQN